MSETIVAPLVDGSAIDYSGLPEAHRETARLYIEHGYEPGSGWRKILAKDLLAVCAVDDATREQLPVIVRWLYNRAPTQCWGSEAAVLQWLQQHSDRRLLRRLEGR